jgi:hypothetical protein
MEDAFEEGQGPHRAVEPLMMVMVKLKRIRCDDVKLSKLSEGNKNVQALQQIYLKSGKYLVFQKAIKA